MVTIVDICNTLADVNSPLAEAGFDVEHYPSSNLFPGFFKTPEGLQIMFKAEPIPDSVYALNVFACLGPVIYLTSRPREAEMVTRRWLKRHGYPAGRVIFTQDKLSVLRRFTGNILFADDDPVTALEAAEAGYQVHLIDWPYNRHVNHRNIVRVQGLEGGTLCAS